METFTFLKGVLGNPLVHFWNVRESQSMFRVVQRQAQY